MNQPTNRIHLCLAHMSEDGIEQKYIKKAFDDNYVVPQGPNVNQFERELEAFVGPGRRVVALSCGTAAVHLALINCGVKAGDEVLVQNFTFCASSNPVIYLGAKPVFVGSEPETWNMDPELLEAAIVDRFKKTGSYPKAIVPVTLYGMPYDCSRIMSIADKYEIPVVEDSAEGFGSRYKGRAMGTFGRFGVLSFNGNKMITTSGGGALICNGGSEDTPDSQWFEVMQYATQYRESYPYYQHEKIGYNYRMSNICAGIGIGQMTVAQAHIAHHRHIAELYAKAFADTPGITFHKGPDWAAEGSNYWLNTITIDPSLRVIGQEHAYEKRIEGAVGGAAGVLHEAANPHTDCEPNANVEALRVYLDEAGIEARPLWKPMHKQPVYAGAPAYTRGVETELFKVGMCLPSGPCVSDEDAGYVVETIKKGNPMMQRWEKYQSSLITASRILSVLLAVVPLLILYLLFSVEVGPNADATEIYVRNLSSVFAYVVMGFFFDFFYLVHTDRYLLFMKPLRITTVILAIAGIIKALISLYYLIIYLFNGNIVLWFYVGEFLIWTVVAFFGFFYSQRLKE